MIHRSGVFAILLLGWCSAPLWAATADRPNFLFLLTDDQRAGVLSCEGYQQLQTPSIDRVAAEGVRFTNAFVTTSVCWVSRASYITGCYAKTHGVCHPYPGNTIRPEILAHCSYPALLKNAGYRTGMIGKYGIKPPEGLFDFWDAYVQHSNYLRELNGETVHDSTWLARRAENFLRSGDGKQPFCLAVCYKSPHEPFTPDPQQGGLFTGVTFPVPETFTDADFAAQPQCIRESINQSRTQKDQVTKEGYPRFMKNYLGCVASVDRSVGRILSVLEELNLLNNTIIIYASDNGHFFGEHGLTGKWLMYEESIRVPLIIRDPRLPAAQSGTTRDAMVLNIDVAPTMLELAGLPAPAQADGRSLKPLLEGRRVDDWRTEFFYEHHETAGQAARNEGVRTTDMKYIAYYPKDGSYNPQRPMFEQLFDLKKDAIERHNVIADPAYADRLQTLRVKYLAYVRKYSSQLNKPPATKAPAAKGMKTRQRAKSSPAPSAEE